MRRIRLLILTLLGFSAATEPGSLVPILENHGCDVDAALGQVFNTSNNRVVRFSLGASNAEHLGGFGAQLCLKLLPAAASAALVNARLVLEDAEAAWNYGCQGHDRVADILRHAAPPRASGRETTVLSKKEMIVTGSEVELSRAPVVCRGQRVPLERLRAAVANYWFSFSPFMDTLVRAKIDGLNLPPTFMAVHMRKFSTTASLQLACHRSPYLRADCAAFQIVQCGAYRLWQ